MLTPAGWEWCSTFGCGLDWLNTWQTTIAGALALGAAGLATVVARGQLRTMRDQLEENRREASTERNGRLRAARATLPTVLSALCDYAEQAARTIYSAWPAGAMSYETDRLTVTSWEVTMTVPPFPESLIQPLERFVELVPVEDVAEQIEAILREAQVLNSRVSPFKTTASTSTNELATYILQAAAIHARAEALFPYARRQAESVDPKPLWRGVHVALSVFGVRHPGIEAKARDEEERDLPPGDADTPVT